MKRLDTQCYNTQFESEKEENKVLNDIVTFYGKIFSEKSLNFFSCGQNSSNFKSAQKLSTGFATLAENKIRYKKEIRKRRTSTSADDSLI